jgi:cyanate permease
VLFLCPLCFLTIRNVHARGPRAQGREVEPAEGIDQLPEAGQRIYNAGGGSPLFFVRSSVYWANVLCNVANGLAMWGSTTWLLAYLYQVRKYTLIQSGLFVGLGFLLDVCITLYVGFRSDRRQRRAPYGILLYSVVLVAMLISVWTPWALMSALAVVLTIGILASAPTVFQTLLHSYVPRPSMGRASGIMSFINNSISSVSPVIVGMLVGIHNNWNAAFVWLMFWPLVALGVMIWFQKLRL